MRAKMHEIIISLFHTVIMFTVGLYMFTTVLTLAALLDFTSSRKDVFNATIINTGLNGTMTVVEISEAITDELNIALFALLCLAFVPITLFLGKSYDQSMELWPENGSRDLHDVPCWSQIIITTLSFGMCCAPLAILLTNSQPDLVTAFSIPNTWYVPRNEEAAESLGIAILSLIFVIPVVGFCVVLKLEL